MTQQTESTGNAVSGLRGRVAAFVGAPRFSWFITVLVLLNAATLGLATNAGVQAEYGAVLNCIDRVIIGLFLIELCLKIFAWRGSFFRGGWNNFDFIIVAISLFPAIGAFSILRTLRIFRVLRLISVVPRMRRVIDALLHAIPGMASVIAVLLVIFYVCAVLATDVFREPELNVYFGDFSNSMFTLFQIMTFEGWPDIARSVMVYHPWAWSFFIIFIIVTSFAILNLFIGIIVDSMNVLHEGEKEEDMKNIHDDAVSIAREVASLHEKLEILNRKLDGRS